MWGQIKPPNEPEDEPVSQNFEIVDKCEYVGIPVPVITRKYLGSL